jgi:hypothetical protein
LEKPFDSPYGTIPKKYQTGAVLSQGKVKVIMHIMLDQLLPHAKPLSFQDLSLSLWVFASLRENLTISA